MQEKTVKLLEKLVYGLMIVGGLFIFGKFIFGWTAPFLVAFALASAAEGSVSALCGRGWKRGFAAAVMTIITLALIGAICAGIISGAVGISGNLAHSLQSAAEKIGEYIARAKQAAAAYAERQDVAMGEYILQMLDSLSASLAALPEKLSSVLLNVLARAAQLGPDVILFAATAGIGMFFISASYPATCSFLRAQLPERFARRSGELKAHFAQSFGGWFRAQVVLFLMTFFELLIAFWLLRVRSAWLIAVLTAIVDALPVFGTGIVLMPWAIYSLLAGDTSLAVGLAVCWGVVVIVRSCAQAKLLGDQIGLDPLASLLALYVGWRVCGVWGMIVFPLGLVLLQKLNESGTLHIWKSA